MLLLSIDQFITKFVGHLHYLVLTNLFDKWSQATKTRLQENCGEKLKQLKAKFYESVLTQCNYRGMTKGYIITSIRMFFHKKGHNITQLREIQHCK